MKLFTYITFAVAISVIPAHAGDIYRHVDDDGNVTYSDTPAAEGNKVEVDPINIDASPKAKPRGPLPGEDAATDAETKGYSTLQITAPGNDTTLRNESQVRVSASLVPGLRQTHRIRFLDNGRVIAPATRNMSLLVNGLERGTHTITAEVISKDGKVIISSAPVAVHVHKASILHPTPATAP